MPATTSFSLQAEVDLILNGISDGLKETPQASHDAMLFVLLDRAGTIERHAVVLKCQGDPEIMDRMMAGLGRHFAGLPDMKLMGVIRAIELEIVAHDLREKVIYIDALSSDLTPINGGIRVASLEGRLVPREQWRSHEPMVPPGLRDFIDSYRQWQAKAVAKWN